MLPFCPSIPARTSYNTSNLYAKCKYKGPTRAHIYQCCKWRNLCEKHFWQNDLDLIWLTWLIAHITSLRHVIKLYKIMLGGACVKRQSEGSERMRNRELGWELFVSVQVLSNLRWLHSAMFQRELYYSCCFTALTYAARCPQFLTDHHVTHTAAYSQWVSIQCCATARYIETPPIQHVLTLWERQTAIAIHNQLNYIALRERGTHLRMRCAYTAESLLMLSSFYSDSFQVKVLVASDVGYCAG